MFTYEISSDFNKPQINPTPCHRINILQEGLPTCTYWYVKVKNTSRSFDKIKDMALVQKIHENGKLLNIGESHSFEIGKDKEYCLERIESTVFIIKSLK